MNKYYILGIVILGVLCMGMSLILQKQSDTILKTKIYTKELSLKNNELDIKLTLLSNNSLDQYRLENETLQGNEILLNEIKGLLTDSCLLIFKMDEFSCETCIETAFFNLSTIEGLNKKNFVILASFSNERRFNSFKKMHDKYNILNTGINDGIFLENRNEMLPPFFALISKSGNKIKISNVFFYIKEMPDYCNQYLNLVKEKLIK